jgi:hypothetical protein
MGVVGLLAFVAFTVRNPSMVASKGSYLLPLMVPAGVLFARGAGALSTGARRMVLCVSAAAALSSALVFTADLVFEPRPLPPTRVLLRQAAELGVPYQVEALKRFLVAR